MTRGSVVRRVRLVSACALGLAAGGALALTQVTVTSPTLIGLQAFSPLAMPLLLVALVVLVLPVGGAVRRSLLVPTVLVLVAGLVLGAVWFGPRWVAHGAAPERGDRLRVLTANLRLGLADPASVLATVRREDPDLVVFEEITPRLRAALEARGLRTDLPYVAGAAASGATGTVLYSRTPLAHPAALALGHGSWAVDVRGLRVWGVHPAYPYDARWRPDQEKLAGLAEADGPDVALGDFNASVDNPPFERFVRQAGLRDAAEQVGAGWQPTWPSDGSRGLPVPLAAIDHVLTGSRVTATGTRVHEIAGTDHLALVADLRLR